MLAAASPLLRCWLRWTRVFPAVFVLGGLLQLGGLLAVLAEVDPAVPSVLLLGGALPPAAVAVQLWRIAWQSLDIAVGACHTPMVGRIAALRATVGEPRGLMARRRTCRPEAGR
ncbi:hypothetical protein [Gandjariella thermophila]|uniref:Uncharacterized protein n=1 Tax=Gandjariella thermophila TaxID=1931992 RepID=A0A4D4JBC1_9PSEU|nr:hypothetical protein [Gandjariella thermophila]GDY32632.1 hypothetical protein GTS_42650 [Gandjariella thermophila]